MAPPLASTLRFGLDIRRMVMLSLSAKLSGEDFGMLMHSCESARSATPAAAPWQRARRHPRGHFTSEQLALEGMSSRQAAGPKPAARVCGVLVLLRTSQRTFGCCPCAGGEWRHAPWFILASCQSLIKQRTEPCTHHQHAGRIWDK